MYTLFQSLTDPLPKTVLVSNFVMTPSNCDFSWFIFHHIIIYCVFCIAMDPPFQSLPPTPKLIDSFITISMGLSSTTIYPLYLFPQTWIWRWPEQWSVQPGRFRPCTRNTGMENLYLNILLEVLSKINAFIIVHNVCVCMERRACRFINSTATLLLCNKKGKSESGNRIFCEIKVIQWD